MPRHTQTTVSTTINYIYLDFGSTAKLVGWLVGVEFNAPLDISEAVFTANHLTDTDKQNSTGKYR